MTAGSVPMPGHEYTRCVKLDDVYDVARGIYYAKKILLEGRKRLPSIPGPLVDDQELPDDA